MFRGFSFFLKTRFILTCVHVKDFFKLDYIQIKIKRIAGKNAIIYFSEYQVTKRRSKQIKHSQFLRRRVAQRSKSNSTWQDMQVAQGTLETDTVWRHYWAGKLAIVRLNRRQYSITEPIPLWPPALQSIESGEATSVRRKQRSAVFSFVVYKHRQSI